MFSKHSFKNDRQDNFDQLDHEKSMFAYTEKLLFADEDQIAHENSFYKYTENLLFSEKENVCPEVKIEEYTHADIFSDSDSLIARVRALPISKSGEVVKLGEFNIYGNDKYQYFMKCDQLEKVLADLNDILEANPEMSIAEHARKKLISHLIIIRAAANFFESKYAHQEDAANRNFSL